MVGKLLKEYRREFQPEENRVGAAAELIDIPGTG
jgi:hypothetical protein